MNANQGAYAGHVTHDIPRDKCGEHPYKDKENEIGLVRGSELGWRTENTGGIKPSRLIE
jgi:hypothetical protein